MDQPHETKLLYQPWKRISSPRRVSPSSLFVAAVATNEVPYSHPRSWPTTADLGVTVGASGTAATNKWLAILAGGDFDSSLIVERDHTLHSPRQPYETMGHTNWREELRRE
jgi:hypothetical protein